MRQWWVVVYFIQGAWSMYTTTSSSPTVVHLQARRCGEMTTADWLWVLRHKAVAGDDNVDDECGWAVAGRCSVYWNVY